MTILSDVSPAVFHAIRAARMERIIGARMARIYARNNGAFELYLIARVLERGV